VLIVEDDDAIRALLAKMFSARGFETLLAHNGADAVSVARSGGKRPDLIVLDLAMPILDGRGFLEQQPQDALLADVPVVLLTARARASRLTGLPENVRAVIEKPFPMPMLDTLLKRLFGEPSLVRSGMPAPDLAKGSGAMEAVAFAAGTGRPRPARELEMRDRGIGLADADVAHLERVIASRLPPDYRKFLIDWNGGVPIPARFHVLGEEREVARFYSLFAMSPLDDLETRHSALHKLVPDDLLAIGLDTKANLLCLGIGADTYGAIYYFSIDRLSRQRDRPPVPICETFSELMASLGD
jgi:CheY-like chemotaxis protein